MRGTSIALLATFVPLTGAVAAGWEDFVYYDLSHPVPTFAPLDGDMLKADPTKPWEESRPIASFGFEGVRLLKPNFETRAGYFQWGYYTIDEHYSTHIDSTHHYQNTAETLYLDPRDNRSVDEYTVDELIAPIVYIDVSARTEAELARNGGVPSPDRNVTDFSDIVTVADIEAVADRLRDGVWLVLNLGWSRFYEGAPPDDPFMHPYTNGLNYPGLGRAEVERLIALEDAGGFRIGGIVADNLSVDSGASGLGSTGDPFGDGWYVHQLGLQRGWKLVENATGLDALRDHAPGACQLIVGAPKIVSATGAVARVIAQCRKG